MEVVQLSKKHFLRKISREPRVKITIFEENAYGRTIYENEQPLSKMPAMLWAIEQKTGFEFLVEYGKQLYAVANNELVNCLRTFRVKVGLSS